MATAKRFEDLVVWQRSRELVREVYAVSAGWTDRSLQDQIRRTAVSVLSNIAEGFERGTNPELLSFLYIARGSCGEVRAQLYVALDNRYVERSTFNRLTDHAEAVSSMLYKFIESIKSSRFKGSKFKKRPDPDVEAFKKYLEDVVAGKARPGDFPVEPGTFER